MGFPRHRPVAFRRPVQGLDVAVAKSLMRRLILEALHRGSAGGSPMDSMDDTWANAIGKP